ncbi:uncharacterized protein TRIADDRAFT_61120 [Trichoplax adhaerens]|uniref:Carboxylic ester hydrolase n=1 Tax=Trichoplax adhaerens TaxID=10228 RepID=B3SA35_TRIAD|nr:hypothetical protein TRIADDRAFT_61120 [Trichoplax adhaerens]EDV20450.1 hypothetical protein TRIADDRAFT_61120 [Trichoplax adhaerens]|eukprot:XP_002117144.1 hypothetical protein TRIADDRAFT_61120 [Trichoplax adhaerens]
MKTVVLALVLINLVCNNAFIQSDLTVQIDSGKIKGNITPINSNQSCFTFLGIPYAQPPVRNFRFYRPVQPTKWTGIRQATTTPKLCYHSIADSSTSTKSEDCLYLNIYVPANQSSNNPLPVLVWLHGDSPSSMNTELFNGQAFAVTGKLIVVTFDFRQGVLGYLTGTDTMGRSIITPNLGILDQVMALQWIQKNIANFGGNPRRVTLAGTSTGAFSIGLQFLNSTQQHGLYQRIALVSGSPLMPRMYYSNLNATNKSMQQFLKKSHCSVQTTAKSILSCLRNLPIANILSVQSSLTPSTYDNMFKAVIDGNIIQTDPVVALNNNQFNRQVQVMASVANPVSGSSSGIQRQQFITQLDWLFSYTNLVARSAIENRYTDWNNESSPVTNQQQLSYLYSDYIVTAPLVSTLKKFAAQGISSNPVSNNPVVWPKYNSNTGNYLKVALAPQVYSSPRANYVAFWNQFWPQLTKQPKWRLIIAQFYLQFSA